MDPSIKKHDSKPQQDHSSQQEENQQSDLPPKLCRKVSKYVDDEQDKHSVASGTPSSDSCDHYPVRGKLSVNLRAQDCKSGIYDTPPSGTPKKVNEDNVDQTTGT